MRIEKEFTGVMDKESSVETMDLRDYLKAINATNLLQGDSKTGYLTSVKGNFKVTNSDVPLGQNKSVGSEHLKERGVVVFVRYNSLRYHQIVEFDYNNLRERIIFENITDSNGEDIFNIGAETYFSSIRAVGEVLLLNNGETEVYQFNIHRERGDYLTKEDISLAKKPLPDPPKYKYVNHPRLTINHLKSKLFQFKSQVEYENNMATSWSHTSDRVVPIDEPSDGIGQNVLLNNALEITVKIRGISRPQVIRVCARRGNEVWALIKEVDFEEILKLPLQIDLENGIEESYNPSNGEYKLTFKDDGAYPILDQVEVENLYDHQPDTAKAMEVVNGNIVVLGGITEGKERPNVKMTSQVSYYEPNITNVVSEPSSNKFRWVGTSYTYQRELQGFLYANGYTGAPKEGDKVVFVYAEKFGSESGQNKELEYTVTLGDEASSLKETLQKAVNFYTSFGLEGVSFSQESGTQYEYIDYVVKDSSPYFVSPPYVKNFSQGSLSTQSINALKNNSSYQLSLNLYDKYMRPFPIVTGEELKVNTDALSKTAGKLPQITVSIEGEAPEGAKYYRFGITENKTTSKYITLAGTLKTQYPFIEEYITIKLKSLKNIRENHQDSPLNYSFTKGDRVHLLSVLDSRGRHKRWFGSATIDLEVLDFKVEGEGNDKEYLLKVRGTSLIDDYWVALNMNGDGVIILEIYTPKPESSDIFYEVGDTYEIVDNQFSVPSTTIRTGDSYFKGRYFPDYPQEDEDAINITTLVADPNFSDDYESNYWSNGTPRVAGDTIEPTNLKGSIRFSGEYVHGSKINEINRFYPDRIYGEIGGETNRTHGWIRKLLIRDNTLVVLQELKLGIIPVYRAVIEDNSDNILLADSGKLFGSVNYRAGDYGCGTALKSVVKAGSVIYFVDDNKGEVVRDTVTNGVEPIGGKMTNFFKRKIKKAKEDEQDIVGYFEEAEGEYLVTIGEQQDKVTTLNFELSRYEDLDVPLNQVTVEQPALGTASYNSSTGILTYTHTSDSLGRDDITLKLQNGEDKVIPLTVISGNTDPTNFIFVTRDNVKTEEWIVSNTVIITGINTVVNVSVEGGQYSKNGGAYTSSAGTAVEGDTFSVRGMSSSLNEEFTIVTLTVGERSSSFVIKTEPAGTREDEVVLAGQVMYTGGEYKVEIFLTDLLADDILTNFTVTYKRFGSTYTTSPQLVALFSGTQQEFITLDLVGDDIEIVRGDIIPASTVPLAGKIVNLQAGGTAVFGIESQMEILI